MRLYVCAIALAGCAASPDPRENRDDVPLCARISGADLGRRVTVQVPAIDAAVEVTVTSWLPKRDAAQELVGFTVDVPADFVVKADFNYFYASGAAWQNPFGDSGTLAKAIEYVDVCDAAPDQAPPLPGAP